MTANLGEIDEGQRRASPATVVIFGASGDLTARKLVPALRQLAQHKRLPDEFAVVGVARTALDDEEFRRRFFDEAGGSTPRLAEGFRYLSGPYDDPNTYFRLRELLDELDRSVGTAGNRLFYVATPPQAFPHVVSGLTEAGLNRGTQGGFTRVVIEKPYGRDERTARELDDRVHAGFVESQVFRIDHYLGKDTVQNVLAFGSPTPYSSRSGTGPGSIMYRSQWPRPSVWAPGAASTRRPAPYATSCRTTYCRCWPSP